jgi:hypothetical protein
MGRDREVRIDGSSTVQVTEHLLARVFDPAWGARRFGPFRRMYNAAFSPLVVHRARIWHSRTEFTDLPRSAVEDSVLLPPRGTAWAQGLHEIIIRFPKMKPGDVAELLLDWRLEVGLAAPPGRWVEETFGAEEPVVEQQLSITVPGALEASTKTLGPPLQARVYNLEGFKRHVWVTGNLPAIPCRFLEGPLSRVPLPPDSVGAGVSRVLFTTVGDWETLSDVLGSRWQLAWTQHANETDQIVTSVTASLPDLTARAVALEKYTQREIRTLPLPDMALGPFPADVGVVALDKAGTPRDKACLLVTLLRSAGVRAFPVAVHSGGGGWDPEIACPDQLDRYLVRAQIPGRDDLWLDPVGDAPAIPPSKGLLFHGTREGPIYGGEAGLVPFPGLAPDKS